MGSDAQTPIEPFEAWLLRRVAHVVEAGEVSGDLLIEFRTEIERGRALPQEDGHARAVHEIARRLCVPVERLEHLLAAFEAEPPGTRQGLLRRIAEAWLAEQGQAYRRGLGAKGSSEDPR